MEATTPELGGHSLHDVQSYSHLYRLLKNPLQGSLSFSFFIGVAIMVSVFFLLALYIVVSVLCNCLAWGIYSICDVQVLPISTPPATSSSSRFAIAFSK